jgi:hypothetical protein
MDGREWQRIDGIGATDVVGGRKRTQSRAHWSTRNPRLQMESKNGSNSESRIAVTTSE